MNTGREREPLISGGLPTQLVDVDPEETQEWRESLDDVIDTQGAYRARYLMLSLLATRPPTQRRCPVVDDDRLHQHDSTGAGAVVPRR